MKRLLAIISICAAAALAFTACDIAEVGQPDVNGSLAGKRLILHASWSDGQATKTAVQSNGTSVWWTTGEQLNVFYGTTHSGKFTSLNTEPAASAPA